MRRRAISSLRMRLISASMQWMARRRLMVKTPGSLQINKLWTFFQRCSGYWSFWDRLRTSVISCKKSSPVRVSGDSSLVSQILYKDSRRPLGDVLVDSLQIFNELASKLNFASSNTLCVKHLIENSLWLYFWDELCSQAIYSSRTILIAEQIAMV